MKPSDLPFEAQYTAWIDGCLPERERAAFEAECERRGISPPQAEADRHQTWQLGNLLRQNASAAAPLSNPDFFNAQLLRQIQGEMPRPEKAARVLPLRRLVWGGLASLGAATLLFAGLVLPTLHQPGPPPEYYAQILNAQTADPTISAVAMHPKDENVTILWIDGLHYVPAEKAKD